MTPEIERIAHRALRSLFLFSAILVFLWFADGRL